MNSALELHDSRLSSLKVHEGAVIVALRPAYLHMSDGRPGQDQGTGWDFDLDLRLPGASVEGAPADFPVDLLGGSLEAGGVRSENLLPFPLPAGVPVELVLLHGQGRIVIRGTEIVPEPRREPLYLEEFPGRDQEG